MSWFKRLCLFIFGVAGLLSLAALALTWVGPWTTQARSMLEVRWYFITLEVLVCITALGLLICFLMSLFALRNPRESMVAEVAGGQIVVTRAAIVSAAKHIVEDDGTCIAQSVRVKMRKRGHIRVFLRVQPKLPMDVVAHGAVLYDQLGTGLARICGESVQSINVVFTEPEQQGNLPTYVDTEPKTEQAETTTTAQPIAPISTHPITVPVSVVKSRGTGESSDADEPSIQIASVEAVFPPEVSESEDASVATSTDEDSAARGNSFDLDPSDSEEV